MELPTQSMVNFTPTDRENSMDDKIDKARLDLKAFRSVIEFVTKPLNAKSAAKPAGSPIPLSPLGKADIVRRPAADGHALGSRNYGLMPKSVARPKS